VHIGATYYDSGGDDTIIITGHEYFVIHDGDAGTDDVVDVIRRFPNDILLEFNAGSGTDVLTFSAPSFSINPDDVLIDFGSYISGTVHIDGLVAPDHTLSFDGLDGMTTTLADPTLAPGTMIGAFDSNSIYIFADGDTPVNGASIHDYSNLVDVTNFLMAGVTNTVQNGEAAIFIIHNQTKTTASGDDHDVYFYHYLETDGSGGISERELTLLGSADLLLPFGGIGVPALDQTSVV
jgi:hypothetical protein